MKKTVLLLIIFQLAIGVQAQQREAMPDSMQLKNYLDNSTLHPRHTLQSGDLIFWSKGGSVMEKAITASTGEYTHVALVERDSAGSVWIIEAIPEKGVQRNFSNWDALGMTGGSIFVDGRMVAFTYGSAVTIDTLDVCVEKADRHVEGAFAIINQQFAEHLPEQYIYLNREEDMGIPGLRQAKLSYHPEILLTYNVVHITKND